MQIDLYHVHRGLHFTKFVYPIVLDVLRVWARDCGWSPRVAICQERSVDLDTDAPVVGFSVYTQTAPAVYRLAAQLRERGKIVLFGGPHFRGPSTFEEASPYCDAIAPSINQVQMRDLLGAIERGEIRPGRAEPVVIRDEENAFRYPDNFIDSLDSRRWYQVPTIPTSLGCPYDCSFCAAYQQGRYFTRDIDTIQREVSYAPGRTVIFCDASFGLNRGHTIEMMRSLAPLKKNIAVETTLARLKDPTLLDALALGGVKWIVVGIETLDLKLRKHGSVDLEDSLRRVLDRAHSLGISVQGNFICGLDSDGPDSFDRIFDFYSRSALDTVMIGILTPYPNTSLYRELDRSGRIFDRNWEHYDGYHVVYLPKNMSVDQLIDGYLGLYKAIRKHRPLHQEVAEDLSKYGLSAQALVPIGMNLYQKFDSVKKARMLRRNQRDLARRDLAARIAPGAALASMLSPTEVSRESPRL